MKICYRVGIGFAVLGFVGFFVKMIFIVRYLSCCGGNHALHKL